MIESENSSVPSNQARAFAAGFAVLRKMVAAGKNVACIARRAPTRGGRHHHPAAFTPAKPGKKQAPRGRRN